MAEIDLKVERCARCVTPANYPGASVDSKGVCYYCREYEKLWGNWENERSQKVHEFEKLLMKAKRRSKQYDVLVPLSGGKDSTYVLYLATKVYKMKTLAYTFDNGFLTDVASENIKNAIEATGADHYLHKIHPQRLMRLYKHFFEYTSLFCPVCMRGMSFGRIALRRQYGIPLILRGTSRRTEEWVTPEIFQDSSLYYFKNVLDKFPVDFNVRDFYLDRSFAEKFALAIYLLSRKRILIGAMDIQVPDYLDWDYDKIYKTIEKEFGWRKLPDRDEHIDCLIEPAVHYIRRQKIPELTSNTLRYSAMIRTGMMKREYALSLVNKEMTDENSLPEETQYLLSRLGISPEEFKDWSKSSFRHMEFQKMGLVMKLFTIARKYISRDSARG